MPGTCAAGRSAGRSPPPVRARLVSHAARCPKHARRSADDSGARRIAEANPHTYSASSRGVGCSGPARRGSRFTHRARFDGFARSARVEATWSAHR